MEIWKPIPNYEGLYEASNLGRVRSTPGKVTSSARFKHRVWKSRIMHPKHPKNVKRQDLRLTLWKNGKKSDHLVSRLIASAWIGIPKDGMTVNHINGDYTDNRPSNLEWISLSENIKHGFSTGLYDSIQKGVKLTREDGTIWIFRSMSQASNSIGRNKNYISDRLKRNSNLALSKDGYVYKVSIL